MPPRGSHKLAIPVAGLAQKPAAAIGDRLCSAAAGPARLQGRGRPRSRSGSGPGRPQARRAHRGLVPAAGGQALQPGLAPGRRRRSRRSLPSRHRRALDLRAAARRRDTGALVRGDPPARRGAVAAAAATDGGRGAAGADERDRLGPDHAGLRRTRRAGAFRLRPVPRRDRKGPLRLGRRAPAAVGPAVARAAGRAHLPLPGGRGRQAALVSGPGAPVEAPCRHAATAPGARQRRRRHLRDRSRPRLLRAAGSRLSRHAQPVAVLAARRPCASPRRCWARSWSCWCS